MDHKPKLAKPLILAYRLTAKLYLKLGLVNEATKYYADGCRIGETFNLKSKIFYLLKEELKELI